MRNLIIKGKTIHTIHISAGDSSPEQYAASQLAKYLETIAGITVSQDADCTITLGIDASAGHDGYRIGISDDGGLTILGGNGRGVIYGVYEFLEHYAGCRFFMPDLETLGEGDIIVDEGRAYAPVLEFRQSDWMCGDDLEWSVKAKINNRTIPLRKRFPEYLGGCQKYANGWFAHTMTELTDEKVPCLSNPENLKKAIFKIREALKNDPEATIVTVSQNDGLERCQCEKCRAVNEEEGSPIGLVLRFCNAIADDLKEDYPNLVVDTLSYVYSRKPPKITRPRENVCIRLCSFECCSIHPLTDPTCPENKKFYDDLIGWNKICDRIYIWDYVTNFVHSIPVYPNFDTIRENMRFYADHGVKGIYPEGNYYAPKSGEFGELRCYLLAKLMWNPYMSTTEYYAHMDEFMAAYYGKGWHYIRAYIDWAVMEARGRHFRVAHAPFEIIPQDRYEAMEETIDAWWDKAEAMAGDRLEAVKRSRFQWRYMKLMLHPNVEEGAKFLEEVKENQINWSEWRPFPEDVDFSETPDLWLKNYPS